MFNSYWIYFLDMSWFNCYIKGLIIFSVYTRWLNKNVYCKPTFFTVWEIFAMLARASSSSRIFLAASQPLSYCCNNFTGLDKICSRSKAVAKRFIGSKSRNKVVGNKSWLTVCNCYHKRNYLLNYCCTLLSQF